ncbi:13694_t:CDS:10, partial [Ambispora leptoticha]
MTIIGRSYCYRKLLATLPKNSSGSDIAGGMSAPHPNYSLGGRGGVAVEDTFELVESSSHWERFTTLVEEVLTGWGVTDGKLGNFEEFDLYNSQKNADYQQQNLARNSKYLRQPYIKLFQKHNHNKDDDHDNIINRHNPASEFLPIHSIYNSNKNNNDPRTKFDKIHRWTGLTHILVLIPMSRSDPAGCMPSTTKMDLYTTKELISAFEKAFHNTRCNLPVFIPIGQLVNSLYNGYMCCWINDHNDKEAAEEKGVDDTKMKDFKVELRFNTALLRDTSIGDSHLAGLTEYFAQRVKTINIDSKNDDSINEYNKENDDDDYSRDGGSNIVTVAGLFTYELQNWDDEDWRRLDDENSDLSRPLESVNTSFEEDLFLDETDNVTVFVDPGSTVNNPTNTMASIASDPIPISANTPTSKSSPVEIMNVRKSTGNSDFSAIHHPSSISNLPFGPSKNPLESIILTAFFPSAPQDFYLKNDVFSEMDAGSAPVWIIKCNFALENSSPTLLSGILENLIYSWIRDRSTSSGSGYAKNSKSIESKVANGNTTNITTSSSNGNSNNSYNYTKKSKLAGNLRASELQTFETIRSPRGGVAIVDTGDIDNFVQALFDPSRFSKNSSSSSLSYTSMKTCDGIDLVSTIDLSHNIRNTSFVPYKSFLWNLLEYLLETVSSTSNFQHCSSFIGSLKIVWTEVLKHIRTYWERNVVIDIRTNILHQKLCMINHCITRLRKMQKENPKLSSSPISYKPRVSSTSSVASSFNSINNTMNKGGFMSIAEQKQKILFSDGNNGGIIGSLDDTDSVCSINDPSVSVVLVGQGNSSGAIENSSTINVSPNMDDTQISNADSSFIAESDDEAFLTDVSASPLGIPRNSKNNNVSRSISYHRRSPSFSHGQSFSPTQSLFSDQSDQIPHSSSLTESFIQLNYSSSMESASGFDFIGKSPRNDITKSSSKGVALEQKEGDEYFEVRDENMREGHSRVSEKYTLIKTKEPMWEPITQDSGIMTEDMIREQQEYFEKLGTSEEAAKKRFQIQSAPLKSGKSLFCNDKIPTILLYIQNKLNFLFKINIKDMEAFKAANPHAIFEDFIRWYSPRDWIPDENGDPNSGKLSSRMSKEGFWKELWKSSRRIPASRQKPLFNHSREGEKALRYLEQLSMQDLFNHLLPTVFLIAYDTLLTHPVTKHMKPVAMGVSLLSKELMSFPWPDLKTENAFEKILERIRENELIMGKAISLLRKLPKQFYLVERILKDPETTVANETEREAVRELFASGASLNSAFPLPTSREFVLQTTTKLVILPNISIHIPLRMYVLSNENGIRVIEMI